MQTKQFKINTKNCTNWKIEVAILLSLVQFPTISFFFGLKKKSPPLLNSVSHERNSTNRYPVHMINIMLLFDLFVIMLNTQLLILTLLIQICFIILLSLSFIFLWIFLFHINLVKHMLFYFNSFVFLSMPSL